MRPHPCHLCSILMADFQNTQGIIFVVDSNDRERITEAREERAFDVVSCGG